MKTYEIYHNGCYITVIDARDEDEALNLIAKEANYSSYEEMHREIGGYGVTATEVPDGE